jgi:murein DD-endopeptidase MepM/ murein hydrolase activator NlpD
MNRQQRIVLVILLLIISSIVYSESLYSVLLPVMVNNRSDYQELSNRALDGFGAYRTAGHKHSGLDIKGEYNESIYSIGKGIVTAIYGEYPYKTVIIEHQVNNETVYSCYTHVEDITVRENEQVNENTRIGRMFNKEEYIKSEFYENHVHFEIRKSMERYKSISIKCFTLEELNKYFYDPQVFFKKYLRKIT